MKAVLKKKPVAEAKDSGKPKANAKPKPKRDICAEIGEGLVALGDARQGKRTLMTVALVGRQFLFGIPGQDHSSQRVESGGQRRMALTSRRIRDNPRK